MHRERSETVSVDDRHKIVLIPELVGAETRALHLWLPAQSQWWGKIFEAHWLVALGRSRAQCAIVSGALHLTVFLLLFFTLQHASESRTNDMPWVVPAELVTIGDETNMAAMVTRDLPYASSDHQADAPAPKPEAATGPEMKLFPAPPQSPPESNTADGQGTSASPEDAPPASLKDAKHGEYEIRKIGKGTAMTMSVVHYLRNQIAQCWRPTPNLRPQTVVFDLFLDGSGAIERPPHLVQPTGQTSDAIAAAESIRQAIYTCAPYRLPADRRPQWGMVAVTFEIGQVRDRRRH